jgi:hypothetical protein
LLPFPLPLPFPPLPPFPLLPLLPLRPPPPLGVVEVLLVGGGLVAVLIVVGVVFVFVAVELVVAVLDVVVAVLDVVAVAVVVVFWQSFAASCWTVEAPWLRSLRRVVSIVLGRALTALAKPWDAFAAAPQFWAPTAEETLFSWLESVFA